MDNPFSDIDTLLCEYQHRHLLSQDRLATITSQIRQWEIMRDEEINRMYHMINYMILAVGNDQELLMPQLSNLCEQWSSSGYTEEDMVCHTHFGIADGGKIPSSIPAKLKNLGCKHVGHYSNAYFSKYGYHTIFQVGLSSPKDLSSVYTVVILPYVKLNKNFVPAIKKIFGSMSQSTPHIILFDQANESTKIESDASLLDKHSAYSPSRVFAINQPFISKYKRDEVIRELQYDRLGEDLSGYILPMFVKKWNIDVYSTKKPFVNSKLDCLKHVRGVQRYA